MAKSKQVFEHGCVRIEPDMPAMTESFYYRYKVYVFDELIGFIEGDRHMSTWLTINSDAISLDEVGFIHEFMTGLVNEQSS